MQAENRGHCIPIETADARLAAYAQRILAGTGLTVADVTDEDPAPVGSAAEALRHGWDMARRAEQLKR